MALKTLTSLIAEARELPNPEAQAVWLRNKRRLAPDDKSIRDMKNFVPGCEHPVWLSYNLQHNSIEFRFSCDHIDSQGVAGIIVEALSGLNAKEIRNTDFSEFRDIARYLNNRQQRTLNAMLNRIKDIIGEPHG